MPPLTTTSTQSGPLFGIFDKAIDFVESGVKRASDIAPNVTAIRNAFDPPSSPSRTQRLPDSEADRKIGAPGVASVAVIGALGIAALVILRRKK